MPTPSFFLQSSFSPNRAALARKAKMRRVVDTMAKVVGLPLVQRTPTKFLLEQGNFVVESPGGRDLGGPPAAGGSPKPGEQVCEAVSSWRVWYVVCARASACVR